MDVFVFVLAIVAIGCFTGIYKERLKNQAKIAKYQNADVEERFREMEERIQTLERIVTDQKSQLRDKIDAL
ncbi:MAG: hypothetical protein P8X74_21845 [Reinekea sp.]|jgi:Tfp pilus assembly protein PilE